MKRLGWLLSGLLSLSLLNACDGAKIDDVPACEHMAQRLVKNPTNGHLLLRPSPTCMEKIGEVECGHCVRIISQKEFFVGEETKNHFNGKPWSQLRSESIYLPAEESYGPLSVSLINLCKKTKCNEEVTRFKVKLNVLNLLEKK